MKRIGRIGVLLALGAGLVFGATGARATTVITDSPYSPFKQASNAYADQLTAWFGKGSLTLTSIFDSSEQGKPLPAELDAIVSGKGPTFTILRMSDRFTGKNQMVGFYNPLNGVTAFGGNAGETSYDAFLFNFTTNRVLRPVYDPTVTEDYRISNVRAGTDFLLDDGILGQVFTYPELYADSFGYKSLLWTPNLPGTSTGGSGPTEVSYNYLEVYSISVDALAAAVPEPATWATMLVGFGLIGGVVRSSRRRTMAVSA